MSAPPPDSAPNERWPAIVLPAAGHWVWSALSGLLLALAFPHHPGNPCAGIYSSGWAFVALVPLIWNLSALPLRAAFRHGWLTGLLFCLGSLYWVAHTQGGGAAVVGGTLLLAAYLGVYVGAFAAALGAVRRRWGTAAVLLAPVLWTAQEFLLSLGELGFPWLMLAQTQAAHPSLIQCAEYTGAIGISFWLVAINALVYLSAASPWPRRHRAATTAVVALVVALPWLWGLSLLAEEPPGEGHIRVGLVQNNLGREKWQPGGLGRSFRSLTTLSRVAAASHPDLLVWPETALPCHVARQPLCGQRLQGVVDELGIPLLTGAPGVDGATGEPQNAAFFLRPDGPQPESYAKMHLVPFGERTPFRDRIPFLRDIDWATLTGDLGPAEFGPGARRTIFSHPRGRFGVLICFEAVFPDLVRRTVAEGAEFLVNITNDSWFGPTAGPYQHAGLTVLRAVENRIAIARCATSGISLFIDPLGRVSQATGLAEAATRVGDLSLRERDTFYTRHGDVFAQVSLLIAAIVLAWCRLRPDPFPRSWTDV
ncbi:apolipoprotein N-acyltransferase [Candidatus Latescibacterota bacterium]